MRIAFIIFNADNSGSVMDITHRQAEHLVNIGCEVHVFSNRSVHWTGVEYHAVEVPTGHFRKFVNRLSEAVGRRLPRRLAFFDIRTVIPFAQIGAVAGARIASEFQENPFDRIVVCQHPCVLGIKRFLPSTPVVLVAHGDVFTHPPGAFRFFVRKLYEHAARYAYKHASALICVSHALAHRALQLGAEPSRVAVLPNGIDPVEIGLTKTRHDGSDRQPAVTQLLFVGRLSAEKGLEFLIEAMRINHDLEVVLTIVGEGPELPDLRKRCADLIAAERVVFCGRVPRERLGEFYLASDIVVLPSLTEGQPLVTLEAMAAGRPIVASNVGGIPDSVEDGITGILVRPGHAHELADAIRRLVVDQPLREQMAAQAHAASSRFEWPALLKRYTEIVESSRI